ncbi:hypothetical protein OIE75_00655 [Streptomyces sp. NBC_01723]|uniref:hypothetical protein n=1 Tax=Streptomyces sp. NBC_01723 TaxID=2975921 RepID=UPI002E306BBE|nr:hypothetical protein [Streptomyces sp. NBC_01723]
MPTYETLPRLTADLHRLTPEQHRRFHQAVEAFLDDLRTGRGRFRAGLRVMGVRSAPGVFAAQERRTTRPAERFRIRIRIFA